MSWNVHDSHHKEIFSVRFLFRVRVLTWKSWELSSFNGSLLCEIDDFSTGQIIDAKFQIVMEFLPLGWTIIRTMDHEMSKNFCRCQKLKLFVVLLKYWDIFPPHKFLNRISFACFLAFQYAGLHQKVYHKISVNFVFFGALWKIYPK